MIGGESEERVGAGEGMLSIVVPNLNGVRYLKHTLRSLCAQGQHVRWRLQDGQSEDNSVEVASAFQRSGDVIAVEKDAGQADAINRALYQIGGQILGYLNSDDCLASGAAEAVLAAFEQNPDADIVYGSIEYINEDGESLRRHQGSIKNFDEIMNIYSYWWSGRQWVQPEVFFRRHLFERLGGFDNRYRLVFDFDFWLRAFASGAKACRVPNLLAQFRLHPAQKSRNAELAAAEIRDSVTRHLHLLQMPSRSLLSARLSYDKYRLNPCGSMFQALLLHPLWLLDPAVWKRARISLSSRCQRPIKD